MPAITNFNVGIYSKDKNALTPFVALINTLLDPHWGGSVLAQTQAESSFESLVIPYFLRMYFPAIQNY